MLLKSNLYRGENGVKQKNNTNTPLAVVCPKKNPNRKKFKNQ
jgi:hypothetical protein